jgi:hypothetical protein
VADAQGRPPFRSGGGPPSLGETELEDLFFTSNWAVNTTSMKKKKKKKKRKEKVFL